MELKPCPFCGGEAIVFVKDWDNRADEYKIVCSKCGVQQEDYTHHKEKAIEAWNSVCFVKVVRCRDCKHIETVEGGIPYCAWHCSGCGENDFCSYGERRADDA